MNVRRPEAADLEAVLELMRVTDIAVAGDSDWTASELALDVGRPRPDARCLALRARRTGCRLRRLLRQGQPAERRRLRPSGASRAGDRLGDPAADRGAGARGGAEHPRRGARLPPERDPRSGRGDRALLPRARLRARAGLPGDGDRPRRGAGARRGSRDRDPLLPAPGRGARVPRRPPGVVRRPLGAPADSVGGVAGEALRPRDVRPDALVGCRGRRRDRRRPLRRAAARPRSGLDRRSSACDAPTAAAGSRRRS